MPQSLTATTIGVTSKLVCAALEDKGFRRRSPHLLRQSQDVLHGIHFQASQWGTASDGRFTANLIVTAPALYEAWTGKPLPANPATASYPIQQRIGFCLPRKTDFWWTVDRQTDTESLAQEAAAVIEHHATAFFALFPNMSAILTHLRETGTLPGLTRQQAALAHAHLAHLAGASGEAENLLSGVLALATNSPFKSTVRDFANRVGIAVAQ